MKESILGNFIAKLRDDRRLEILVYSALILTAAVIFISTGGISCRGNEAATGVGKADKALSADRTELESRLENILQSIEGAGSVRVMAVYESGREGGVGNVKGVMVVAEGASDIGVRVRLQTAVTTVLGIDPNCVGVFKMR